MKVFQAVAYNGFQLYAVVALVVMMSATALKLIKGILFKVIPKSHYCIEAGVIGSASLRGSA